MTSREKDCRCFFYLKLLLLFSFEGGVEGENGEGDENRGELGGGSSAMVTSYCSPDRGNS